MRQPALRQKQARKPSVAEALRQSPPPRAGKQALSWPAQYKIGKLGQEEEARVRKHHYRPAEAQFVKTRRMVETVGHRPAAHEALGAAPVETAEVVGAVTMGPRPLDCRPVQRIIGVGRCRAVRVPASQLIGDGAGKSR